MAEQRLREQHGGMPYPAGMYPPGPAGMYQQRGVGAQRGTGAMQPAVQPAVRAGGYAATPPER